MAILNAYFRDMEYLVSVILNMMFWMTPIIYPLSKIPENYQTILGINPMMFLTESWRSLFLDNIINWEYISISALIAIIMVGLGLFVHKKLERNLDEVL